MNRLIPLVAVVLLAGCGGGDPVANDPMLKLNVTRGENESIGRYRISRTGVINESGDSGPSGPTTSETVTVDMIEANGVTLTIKIVDSDGESSKQIVVPYDKDISIAVSRNVTATARLERKQ